jgi:hypothetical protein
MDAILCCRFAAWQTYKICVEQESKLGRREKKILFNLV